MDQASESEEDNEAAMAEDPDDQINEPSQAVEEPHVSSNPAKRRELRLATELKVAPGVLSNFEIPDTSSNRKLIGQMQSEMQKKKYLGLFILV
jgi:hypothetical protein